LHGGYTANLAKKQVLIQAFGMKHLKIKWPEFNSVSQGQQSDFLKMESGGDVLI
jgi:hypothetical protein